MSAFQIKLLAIITMAIDHIGLFFFPQFIVLRLIGRVSLPLFAWLIANGAHHTHNIKSYLLRLFLFALLSQVPFLLPNRILDPSFHELNVLFTLFLGLAAIALIRQTKKKLWWVLITVLCAGFAQVLQTDYDGFGVVVVVLFYLFFDNFTYLVIAQSLLFFVSFLVSLGYRSGSIEPIGLLALFIIRFYTGKPGPKAKYLFYLFYPLQYLVFYFLLRSIL